MSDEQWEDYPEFNVEPENQEKIKEGYWWKCIFCGWDREFSKGCIHCENERLGKTIKGVDVETVCRCGHKLKYHAYPVEGRRTKRIFSPCWKCLDEGRYGTNCVKFEVRNDN